MVMHVSAKLIMKFILLVSLVLILALAVPMKKSYSFVTAVSSEPLGSAEILFADGYENNTAYSMGWLDYTPWGWSFNDVSSENNASIELVNDKASAHHGNMSAKHYATRAVWIETAEYTGWNPTFCNFMKQYSKGFTELYVRWYEKFETLVPAGGYLPIFYTFPAAGVGGGAYSAVSFEIGIWSDRQNPPKRGIYASKMYGTSELNVEIPLETDRWYRFEAWYKYDQVNGEYRVWFDGNEIMAATGINTTPTKGIEYLPGGFDLGALNRDGYNDLIVWTDDVVVANARVGPIGFLDINAYADSEEVIAKLEISDSSGVVASVETPNSITLGPGSYILNASYENQLQTKTEMVSEDLTTSVTFFFKEENVPLINWNEVNWDNVVLVFIVVFTIVGGILIIKKFR